MQNFVVKVYERHEEGEIRSNITSLYSAHKVETYQANGEAHVNVYEGISEIASTVSIDKDSPIFQIIIENANGKTVDRLVKHKVVNTGGCMVTTE